MTHLEHYPEEIFAIDGLETRKDLGYKTINIVMISYVSSNINLKYLYYCLPTAEVDGFDKKATGKVSIPYFNHEDIFVSANYEGSSRGIRKIKKPFKSVLYVDFQCNMKNQHIKISSDNLHITGVRSLEVGVNCIQRVLDKVKEIDSMLVFARGISENVKQKLVSNILEDSADDISDILGDETVFNLYSFLTVNRDLRKAEDDTTYTNFVHFTLFGREKLFEDKLEIERTIIHNTVFYIDIGFTLSLKKLNVLSEMMGHKVIFHNWNTVQYSEIVVKDDEGRKDTTVKIHKSGGVNLWTDSNKSRAFVAFKKLLVIIDKCKLEKKVAKKKYVRKTPRGHI